MPNQPPRLDPDKWLISVPPPVIDDSNLPSGEDWMKMLALLWAKTLAPAVECPHQVPPDWMKRLSSLWIEKLAQPTDPVAAKKVSVEEKSEFIFERIKYYIGPDSEYPAKASTMSSLRKIYCFLEECTDISSCYSIISYLHANLIDSCDEGFQFRAYTVEINLSEPTSLDGFLARYRDELVNEQAREATPDTEPDVHRINAWLLLAHGAGYGVHPMRTTDRFVNNSKLDENSVLSKIRRSFALNYTIANSANVIYERFINNIRLNSGYQFEKKEGYERSEYDAFIRYLQRISPEFDYSYLTTDDNDLIIDIDVSKIKLKILQLLIEKQHGRSPYIDDLFRTMSGEACVDDFVTVKPSSVSSSSSSSSSSALLPDAIETKGLLSLLLIHNALGFLQACKYFNGINGIKKEELFDQFIHLEGISDIGKLAAVVAISVHLNKDKKSIEHVYESLCKEPIEEKIIIEKTNKLLSLKFDRNHSVPLSSMLSFLLCMENGVSLVLKKAYRSPESGIMLYNLPQALYRYKISLEHLFKTITSSLTSEQFYLLLNNDQLSSDRPSSLVLAASCVSDNEVRRLLGIICRDYPLMLNSSLNSRLGCEQNHNPLAHAYLKLLAALSNQDVMNQELIALALVWHGRLTQDVLRTMLASDCGKDLCSNMGINGDDPAVLDDFKAALIEKITDKLYHLLSHDGPALDYLNAIAAAGLNQVVWSAPYGNQEWIQLDRLASTPHRDVVQFLRGYSSFHQSFHAEHQCVSIEQQEILKFIHSVSFFEDLAKLDKADQLFYLMLVDEDDETRLTSLVSQDGTSNNINILKTFLNLLKSHEEADQFKVLSQTNNVFDLALEIAINRQVEEEDADVETRGNLILQAVLGLSSDVAKLAILLKRHNGYGEHHIIKWLPETVISLIDSLILDTQSGAVAATQENLLMRIMDSNLSPQVLIDVISYITQHHAKLIPELSVITDSEGNNLLMRLMMGSKRVSRSSLIEGDFEGYVNKSILPFLGENNAALRHVNHQGYTPLMVGLVHRFQFLVAIVTQYKKLQPAEQLSLSAQRGRDYETVLSLYDKFVLLEQRNKLVDTPHYGGIDILKQYFAYIKAQQEIGRLLIAEFVDNPERFAIRYPALCPASRLPAAPSAVASLGFFTTTSEPSLSLSSTPASSSSSSESSSSSSSEPESFLSLSSRKRTQPETGTEAKGDNSVNDKRPRTN